jgi:hypothetical protein
MIIIILLLSFILLCNAMPINNDIHLNGTKEVLLFCGILNVMVISLVFYTINKYISNKKYKYY